MQTDEPGALPENVLVAGSRKIQCNYEKLSKLARMIGAKMMCSTNWILLNGGASEEIPDGNLSIDYLVCTGAEEELKSMNRKPKERILTIHPKEPDKNLHHIGQVEITKRATEYLRRFDLVAQADAIITIEGGVKGTKDIIELGMALQKPVLPIACTGGTSNEAWYDYEKEILQMFRIKVKPPKEYEMLTDTKGLDFVSELSDLVITKVSDILKPECFIAMPFAEEFNSVYDEAIKPALILAGYNPVRADYIHRPGDIIDQMIQHIRKASIVVADITNLNANVMYELGMADMLGKPLVLVSQKSQIDKISNKLPFDIEHKRIIKYENGEWKKLQESIYEFVKK